MNEIELEATNLLSELIESEVIRAEK